MRVLFVLSLLFCLMLVPGRGVAALDKYQPTEKISGKLTCVGSDTLRILMERWFKDFSKMHPGVSCSLKSKGSNTAPPALQSGKCSLAAMSRPMREQEIRAFKTTHGHRPLEVRVALDALAVYVNKNNPLRGLTIQQLDGIFSSTQKCGGSNLTKWNQLVLGSLQDAEITLYGRNDLSGSHDFFQKKALCGGEFKKNVTLEADSAHEVQAVEKDPAGIGYSGLGYRTDGVQVLGIAPDSGSGYFRYEVEKFRDSKDPAKRFAYVYRGDYPLSRFLYLYVDKQPGKALAPEVEEFLKFVLSKQGQAIVLEIGFIPLNDRMVRKDLKKLAPDYKPAWWD